MFPIILRTAAVLAAGFLLYFYGLTRTGVLGPDEPRYAAIGEAMARSGDWITPRLWATPWFEKPALLYWMTAAGFKLGFSEDLAPRLPVALASAAFLVFFWFALRRQFDVRIACYATAILGTSAGWLGFSHIAVTDLPMAVCLAASIMLLAAKRNLVAAGVLLGLAILAKGLVPCVLFLPALWFMRHRPPQAAQTLTVAAAVAAPWYILVTVRNGMPFLHEFFFRHHLARFVSGEQLHAQPFWYYVPVLLAGIFPWTPILPVLFGRRLYSGDYERLLLAWFLFGFVFFSASKGKLPGYLLPLLPALSALLGIGLARASQSRWMLAASAGLLWLIPAIAAILPQALLVGLSHTSPRLNYGLLLPMLLLAAGVWLLRRDNAVVAIVIGMTAAVFWVGWETYPILDRTVSPRAFWRAQVQSGTTRSLCVSTENKSWAYGLNYYAKKVVPDCNQ